MDRPFICAPISTSSRRPASRPGSLASAHARRMTICLLNSSTPTAPLVTSVQKLFNGRTKFGLHKASLTVGTLVMDDAHACADRIREACRIRIPSEEPGYASLKTLFASDLEQQGVGTFADIENGKREALLPVPYRTWTERESEVASILSSQSGRNSVRFTWPLLRDMLAHCQA